MLEKTKTLRGAKRNGVMSRHDVKVKLPINQVPDGLKVMVTRITEQIVCGLCRTKQVISLCMSSSLPLNKLN